jgi:hypothetical protein
MNRMPTFPRHRGNASFISGNTSLPSLTLAARDSQQSRKYAQIRALAAPQVLFVRCEDGGNFYPIVWRA